MSRVPRRVFLVRGARWDGQSGVTARLLRRADQLAARSATSVIAVSQSLSDLVVEYGISKERPTVLGAGGSKGVDVKRFYPRERPDDRPPTIGFVGRISIDKGIGDLLDVHDYCVQRDPSTRLVVVGPLDPAQPPDLATTTRLQGFNIETHDYVADPSEIIASLDVLVFPSVREGLPNVVIEAAACGVPTVGYDTTGVRDAVLPNETGVLVPLGDTTELAASTWRLLSGGAAEMREQCVRVATTRFSQETVVSNFADYIEGLANCT